MEDYAAYLTSEASSDLAVIHEFMMSYQESDEVHIFFEGPEDIAFYLPEVRRYTENRRIYSYDCGGKWNVVKARDKIETSYKVTTLFLIDRDYDDFLNRQASISNFLYITDGYSIENWASCEKALEVLLEDVLAVPAPNAKSIKRRVFDIQSNVKKECIFSQLGFWLLKKRPVIRI